MIDIDKNIKILYCEETRVERIDKQILTKRRKNGDKFKENNK